MEAVVLVIHLILALAIITLVLLQRSEGGGLGIGGGGGGVGGLASPHSTAGVLTKATKIVAGCFFCTSLLLAILAGTHSRPASLLDQLDQEVVLPHVATEDDGITAPLAPPQQPPAPEVPIAD